ncbi:MAG: hypothetical protein NTY64_03590 [Deltaproteobacteria bacterium]|nr:hypothetical protein [Deltaproteobacteria bacterium]
MKKTTRSANSLLYGFRAPGPAKRGRAFYAAISLVNSYEIINVDGSVKSPSAALRFTFVAAAYHPGTPHSSGFARLASGAFYAAISLVTSYETINVDLLQKTSNGNHGGAGG